MPAPDPSPSPATTELLAAASQRLVRTVDALPDEEYAGPSLLPGWSRGHVVAHLALNAEGLSGSLRGVVQGESVPMYRSREARDDDIAELATASPATLRGRLLGSVTDLADAVAAVPEDRWDTVLERTPGSPRTFRAADVPTMRLLEVEIHHADLGVGYGPATWPAEVAVLVLDTAGRRGVSSGVTVRASDLDRTWTIGGGGPVVSGRAADLAWWLTGRGDGAALDSEGGALPPVGAW